MKWLLVLTVLFGFSIFAADVTGTWKGTADTPNGPIERTFVFKVEGTTLTGETTSQIMGKSVINDGKIDGENISFSITVKFQDNEMKLNYKGKVSGDRIRFTVEAPNGMTLEYDAKKVA
jgi:hypothetical protein